MRQPTSPRAPTLSRTHRHCATHQIRLILINGVVITSLFYPALALYSSSQPQSFSVSDLFSPHPTAASGVPNDLVDVWTGYDALRKREDSVSIATCGVGHTLRVERILIQAPVEEDENALNHRILLSTFDMQQQLELALSSGPSPCLKRSDGTCFVVSPLAFWSYDKNALLSDTNILDTLTYPRNASISGVLITPQMVLAGRGSDEHHVTGTKFDYANYLAITYFFPDRDCVDNTGHQYWEDAIKTAASGTAKVDGQRHPPTIIALEVYRYLFVIIPLLNPSIVRYKSLPREGMDGSVCILVLCLSRILCLRCLVHEANGCFT